MIVYIADPAPTVVVHIQALNSQATVEILPDFETDIRAAGINFLVYFSEHVPNLLASEVRPHTVNGNFLFPIGFVKAFINVGIHSVVDNFLIYRCVLGVLISWKTAKFLASSQPSTQVSELLTPTSILSAISLALRLWDILILSLKKSLSRILLWYGQDRTIPGQRFNIIIANDAKPFCVNTTHTILNVYK